MRGEILDDSCRDHLYDFIQVRFFEVRVYRAVFELIAKNASKERQIDNVSDKWGVGYEKITVRIGSKLQLVSGD